MGPVPEGEMLFGRSGNQLYIKNDEDIAGMGCKYSGVQKIDIWPASRAVVSRARVQVGVIVPSKILCVMKMLTGA